MARFGSVKAALGFAANHRKGPRMASLRLQPLVQNSPKIDRTEWVALVAILTDACAETGADREKLLAFGVAKDGTVPVEGSMGAAMAILRRELEAAGLLSPKVVPVPSESYEFVDENSGEVIRTKRVKRT